MKNKRWSRPVTTRKPSGFTMYNVKAKKDGRTFHVDGCVKDTPDKLTYIIRQWPKLIYAEIISEEYTPIMQ